MTRRLKIGTRQSPLALKQTEIVKDALSSLDEMKDVEIEIVPFMTTGDRIQDRALLEAGGKGLFTKEIEDALLTKEIDLAVHSMKDVPTRLPQGLKIAATLKREDPRDAFVSLKYESLQQMPKGSVLGTAGLRRGAQALFINPGIRIQTLRGNVATRLKKMENGEVEATFLACAGLNRLNLRSVIKDKLSPDLMLPAVCQGIIGIEIRDDDEALDGHLQQINCQKSFSASWIERAFLKELDGSCRTPIAGYADFKDDKISFKGRVLSPDGAHQWQEAFTCPPEDAARSAITAAQKIKAQIPDALYDQIRAFKGW